MFDFHGIGVALFSLASVLSLFSVMAKPLGKEFEAVVLVWIRAFKHIREEWHHKDLTIKQTSDRPQSLNQTNSTREIMTSHTSATALEETLHETETTRADGNASKLHRSHSTCECGQTLRFHTLR